MVRICNGECRDRWTAESVRILKRGCKDPRTAESVQILKGVCRDPRTADLVRISKGECRDPRYFFGRKCARFLICVLKDPHESCNHFYVKIMVVDGRCVGGNSEKLIKNSINYSSLMSIFGGSFISSNWTKIEFSISLKADQKWV